MNVFVRRAASAVFDIASFGLKRTGLLSYSQFYEGANSYSRERTYINPIVGDTDETLDTGTRSEMVGLARNLYTNVGFVRGAVNDVARYTVGVGISPQPLLKSKDKARSYKNYWQRFSRNCELSGRFTFPHLCRMKSRAVDVDGDIGVIFTEAEGSRFPQLQVIESHRIGDAPGQKAKSSDGVIIGNYNDAKFYRVRLRDKQTMDVPASSFHLLFDPDRCDAYRGQTALVHALNHIRDKKDILGFEKLGVKNNSAIAMTLESPADATGEGFFSDQQTTGTGPTKKTTERLLGGAVPRLNPGESLKAWESKRPSTTFTGFLGYLDRDVAVGLGVPVEFIWDTAELKGTAQRFILEKAQRRFEERQDSIFLPFILRVYTYVIARGIANGELEFDPDWHLVSLQRPAKITVDVGREAQANRDDVAAGLRTMQEDYGERGLSLWDSRDDNQTAAEDLCTRVEALIAKHKWLTPEAALSMLEQRGAKQIVINTQADSKPAAEAA